GVVRAHESPQRALLVFGVAGLVAGPPRSFSPYGDRTMRRGIRKPTFARPMLEQLEIRELLDAQNLFLSAVYRDVLGRPIDANGLEHWTQTEQNGMSATAVNLAIVNSTEAHQDAIAQFYTHYLARGVDPLGNQTFTAALDSGMSERQV